MDLTALILSLEGTPAGRNAALWLALLGAMMHALLSALQKGRYDPWLMRGAIDLCYALIALPFVIFVIPFPEPWLWPWLAGSFVLHSLFKLAQAMAFDRGAYTVVYPVIRAAASLMAVALAILVFGESFLPGQWLGLAVLVAGILGLSLANLRGIREGRARLLAGIGMALVTGVLVAGYSAWDAWTIRLTGDAPLTFLMWFFLLDGLLMPLIAARRFRSVPREERRRFAILAVTGGVIAYISLGAILIAFRIGNVGEAAVVRETATVFAAVFGWLILKERPPPLQIAMMGLIAGGAILVKLMG